MDNEKEIKEAKAATDDLLLGIDETVKPTYDVIEEIMDKYDEAFKELSK